MALVGVLVILFGMTFAVWLVAGPRAEKQQEPDLISSPLDGNLGTICAAAWFRMAMLDMRTDPKEAQTKSDTAQAFLDLGKGNRGKAITLSRMLDRTINDRGCGWEWGRDELDAARAAARERRNADKAANLAP